MKIKLDSDFHTMFGSAEAPRCMHYCTCRFTSDGRHSMGGRTEISTLQQTVKFLGAFANAVCVRHQHCISGRDHALNAKSFGNKEVAISSQRRRVVLWHAKSESNRHMAHPIMLHAWVETAV